MQNPILSFPQYSTYQKVVHSGEKSLTPEEQQAKINEVRKLIGPLKDKLPTFCSEASILRYLKARNWNTKKASKMLRDTLKWRLEYKPEKIRWEDIAHEARTGKVYRTDYLDKYGRTVLVMRPGFQNTNSTKGQLMYLVYCMENAILNLAPNQEQMVWLIDFQGWNMSSVSVKVTRETAHILQDYYPERLGLAILYNPPKIFESFWTMVKPFLERKTFKKVKFVYSIDPESQKIMGDVFDMDKLESAFGGRNSIGFDYEVYAERMREDDGKMSASLETPIVSHQPSAASVVERSDPGSKASDDDASSTSDGVSPNLAGINDELSDKKIRGHFGSENVPKVPAEEALETPIVSHQPSVASVVEQSESLISDPGSKASDDDASSTSDGVSPNLAGINDELSDNKIRGHFGSENVPKVPAEEALETPIVSHQPSVASVVERSESLISDPGSKAFDDDASSTSDGVSPNLSSINDELSDNKIRGHFGGENVPKVPAEEAHAGAVTMNNPA